MKRRIKRQLVASGKQLHDKAAVQIMSGEALRVDGDAVEFNNLHSPSPQCQCLEVVTVVRKGINGVGKTRYSLTYPIIVTSLQNQMLQHQQAMELQISSLTSSVEAAA
jgi:hypothetical protein